MMWHEEQQWQHWGAASPVAEADGRQPARAGAASGRHAGYDLIYIENGKASPSVVTLEKLLGVLGVSRGRSGVRKSKPSEIGE